MFGHDGDDVRVVVLHEDDVIRAGTCLGPVTSVVAGMRIRDGALRFDLVHVAELLDRTLEGDERLRAPHVADVLAHPRVVTSREAKGVLELAPDRQRRRDAGGQPNRQRRVAARAADRQFVTVDQADHRVVARHMDRPVVTDPCIGDAPQPLPSVRVLEADRLVGEVAARHHEDLRRRVSIRDSGHRSKEQMVQRRIREHHADQRVRRCDERRQRRIGARGDEHDRPGG